MNHATMWQELKQHLMEFNIASTFTALELMELMVEMETEGNEDLN